MSRFYLLAYDRDGELRQKRVFCQGGHYTARLRFRARIFSERDSPEFCNRYALIGRNLARRRPFSLAVAFNGQATVRAGLGRQPAGGHNCPQGNFVRRRKRLKRRAGGRRRCPVWESSSTSMSRRADEAEAAGRQSSVAQIDVQSETRRKKRGERRTSNPPRRRGTRQAGRVRKTGPAVPLNRITTRRRAAVALASPENGH